VTADAVAAIELIHGSTTFDREGWYPMEWLWYFEQSQTNKENEFMIILVKIMEFFFDSSGISDVGI